MRNKQAKPKQLLNKYRQYAAESLVMAYKYVKERGMPVKRAAKLFNVPQTTLRDRVAERVDPEDFGRETLFTQEEEGKIVEHLQVRAELGYGLTNRSTQVLAGEMAYEFGRRNKATPLSNKWLYAFLNRWDTEIKSMKPHQLESSRAKCSTPEAVDTYFSNLRTVMEENDLLDKPQHIYNLDETGIQADHKPPNIIAGRNAKPQSVTSPRSSTTTVIGCVNALGNAIPPYFVFKGQRWNQDLMKGACTGAQGTMSDSGWSNSDVLREYLQNHFLPYARPSQDKTQPLLLIYDGHASHKSPDTIRWAREQGIILFLLPAHSSHLLQPLDVAMFGPFKKLYHNECAHFMFRHMGRTITKYDICALACRAYLKALTPITIQNGFRKTGIFPLNTAVIQPQQLLPCEPFREINPIAKAKAIRKGPDAVEKFLNAKELELSQTTTALPECTCKKFRKQKSVSGGTAITDDAYFNQICQDKTPLHTQKSKPKHPKSPLPSTSGLHNSSSNNNKNNHAIDIDSDIDVSDSEKENCCVCGRFYPPRVDDMLKIVNWAKCDNCDHWVHLTYCTEERVVRRHSAFQCPHCKI